MTNSPAGEAGAADAIWRELLPSTLHDLLANAALTLAFWGLAVAGFQFAVGPAVATAFWPAAGLTVAAMVLGGVRLWPGVVLGRILAGLTVGAPQTLPVLIALGAAAAVAAALPAWQFRRLALPRDLNSFRAVAWLILSAGVGGATVSSALGLLIAGVDVHHFTRLATFWWFGYFGGTVTVAPVLLAWARRPPFTPRQIAGMVALLLATAALDYVIFLNPVLQPARGWFILPVLVWAAVAFSLPGASLAILITASLGFAGAVLGVSAFGELNDRFENVLLTEQFVAITAATMLILAAVADERRAQEKQLASEARLREESEALDVLNRTGAAIPAELDLDRAVQLVTDAGLALSGAEFGAFFYNVLDEQGESYLLYTLSGAPRSAFERFGQPRNTPVFGPTFAGEGVVRVDDITQDPRYGRMAPHHGMPKGHLPVRSYLAVPVISRTGEVLGGLFYGHSQPGRFTERAERLLVGLAGQGAIAIDNARLYQSAQREIAVRRRAEDHQRLLINELNHRVKNTLATVQSMGAQTLRYSPDLQTARASLEARLLALSDAHNLLTAERWDSASLREVVRMALAPFEAPGRSRFSIDGRNLRLQPSHALALAMAFHELGTNAVKYGALSAETGEVRISWRKEGARKLRLVWEETGGPPVVQTGRRGFGSRLIQDGLARELGGDVRLDYRPEGLRCEMVFTLPARAAETSGAESAARPSPEPAG